MNNNNLDMASLMQILSKMDKSQLEEGIAKANKILKSNNKNDVLNMLNNNSDYKNINNNNNN